MKKKIVIGVIAVFAILGGLYASGFFTSKYFEEPAAFGTWGQDIKVLYEDGTSESLAMLMNKPLSTLTYGGKAITGFTYNLAARATGTGFTDATVTLSTYVLTVKIILPIDLQKPTLGSIKSTTTYTLTSGASTIPIDTVFHPIGGVATFPAKTTFDTLSLAANSYYIQFIPSGTVTFKGNPGGDVQTGSMPSPIGFVITYSKGTLSIEMIGSATSY